MFNCLTVIQGVHNAFTVATIVETLNPDASDKRLSEAQYTLAAMCSSSELLLVSLLDV